METRSPSLFDGIQGLYSSFFLRDFLGFVIPGFIALVSVLWLTTPRSSQDFLGWIVDEAGGDWKTAEIVIALGISYISGLVLQAVHFGVFDWITFRPPQWARRKNLGRLPPWPVLAFGTYAGLRERGKLPVSKVSQTILTSDELVASASRRGMPERVRHSLVYHERLGILTVVRGNLAVASLPLLVALGLGGIGWWALLGLPVIALVYLEHWRTWWFRNERMRVYST